MQQVNLEAIAVFALTLIATFTVTFIARKHSSKFASDEPVDQKINKWLLGLSAGATSNSGFIVTAAVGLGYNYGAQWIMMPLGWLMGDLLFWRFFPHRINRFGAKSKAMTISDIVTHGLPKNYMKFISLSIGVLIFIGLAGYTSAQWLAGQKFVSGAFGFSGVVSLGLFAIIIIAYTSIGGFRGSIYVDSFQAVVRIIGSIIALASVIVFALGSKELFLINIEAAGLDFLNPFALGQPIIILVFLAGFAATSLGFGLGQPQVISRYLAGKNPEETQSAWWIYIGFVQFTWVSMTIFGIILRGLMPDIDDPEAGLSLFFQSNFNVVITGIIIADIFSTIAATSNSLLVAMAQSIKKDIFMTFFGYKDFPLKAIILSTGLITMGISLIVDDTVVTLAIGSISFLGAGLAPAVLVRVLSWQNNPASILSAILIGLLSAVLWRLFGEPNILNEAAIGIAAGLISNKIVCWVTN